MKTNLWTITILTGTFSMIVLFQNCSGNLTAVKTSNSLQTSPQAEAEDESFVAESGLNYFNNTVEPLFQTNCASCHDLPFRGGTATMSIYNYAEMRARLLDGDATTDNALINAMQGVGDHGNVCPAGATRSPCQEIIQWKLLEDPAALAGGLGTVTRVSLTGRVAGWSMDPEDESKINTITVFLGGPAGVGTEGGTYEADISGPGGSYDGHYFQFELPAAFVDGREHELYIYAGATDEANLLAGMPRVFTAYTPSPQGENFFNNTIAGALRTCDRCHGGWSYDTLFPRLLAPLPAGGGTPTNNTFFLNAEGANGHSGGRFCGSGRNAGLCGDIQTWWSLEVNGTP